MAKHTLRRFILSVPTGETEKTMIRTFVRANDGTDYPVDREIEVDKFAPKEIEVEFVDATHDELAAHGEGWVLAQVPAGSIVLETRDIVTVES